VPVAVGVGLLGGFGVLVLTVVVLLIVLYLRRRKLQQQHPEPQPEKLKKPPDDQLDPAAPSFSGPPLYAEFSVSPYV